MIGGGLVGSLCALRLAEAGLVVTVVERNAAPGAEASSAAAGILAAQSESRAPGLMFDLAIESRAIHERLAIELRDRFGADTGWVRCGVLETAPNTAGIEALEAQFAWQRASGHAVQKLTAAEAREREPAIGPAVAGGLAFPDDAQVDAPRLVRAVVQAAERAGVKFRCGVHVRGVKVEGHAVRGVETDEGVLPCAQVVVCAGAWSPMVDGAQVPRDAVRPARGQIVELLTRTPLIRSIVFGAGGYVVPRPDGRVVCGSTLEFVGFRNEVTAEGVQKILTTATTLVPGLAQAVFSRTWSGFRPHTPDGLPLVGESGIDGLTIATGHHRSGILMAPITAELVRDRVCGRASRWDVSPLDPQRASLRVVPGAST